MSWPEAKKIAKNVPITDVLSYYGMQPVRRDGHCLWYYAPNRKEEKASFRVDLKYNTGKDFGDPSDEKGCDTIDLVRRFEPNKSFKDTVHWLINTFGKGSSHSHKISPSFKQQNILNPTKKAPHKDTFKILSIKKIFSPGLFDYLEQRGISQNLAHQWMKQVYFLNRKTTKKNFALAFVNDSGGIEARSKYFKGMVKNPKDVSYIQAQNGKTTDNIHIFEGGFDFLTYLQMKSLQKPDTDTIILHSNNNYKKAINKIRGGGYKKINTWLDNERPGSNAEKGVLYIMEALKEELGLPIEQMNELYAPYKDLNEWYVKSQGHAPDFRNEATPV